jgi:site-specific recombinase XerD|tara:strand:- start:1782 stop:3011 length:1230 start_codon:yes stop_codon:yes gene_type:complete
MKTIKPSHLHLSFYIRKERKNHSGHPVYLKLSFETERKVWNTGIRCSQHQWNRFKIGGDIPPELQHLFLEVTRIENTARAYFQALIEKGQSFTLVDLKDLLGGKQPGWRTHFVSYSNQYLVELEALIGLCHSRELFVKYRRSITYFQEFLHIQFNRDDVRIGRITKSHIKAYYRFLRINKANGHNTAIKSMQLCKKIFTLAIEEGIILKHPFRGFSMSLKEIQPTFLSLPEIGRLRDVQLGSKRLILVRDLFLFACFTGLAYSDIKNLQYRHLVDDGDQMWIRITRKKTGVIAEIPFIHDSRIVLDKYWNPQYLPESRVFPILSNQKMNAYLKEIATVAKVNERLTFHMARHTFATTITLRHGMSLEVLSKVLGHKNLRSTQHYGKIMNHRIMDEMKTIADKLNPSKFI